MVLDILLHTYFCADITMNDNMLNVLLDKSELLEYIGSMPMTSEFQTRLGPPNNYKISAIYRIFQSIALWHIKFEQILEPL